jgi:hypothetical protein
MARVPVNDQILRRAQELINGSRGYDSFDLKKLRGIVSGEVKNIGPEVWRKLNNKANKPKLDKLQAMSDPAHNPNEHERHAAHAMFMKLAFGSPPGLEEYDRQMTETWREAQERKRPIMEVLLDELMSVVQNAKAEAPATNVEKD